MIRIIELVLNQIDNAKLQRLLGQLRNLDIELDHQMEDIRIAQQNVTTWDRINVFTHSDAELKLKAENAEYKRIKRAHSDIVKAIKDLIREAIYCDFAVSLKVQSAELMQSVSALHVKHKYGIGKSKEYRIEGIAPLLNRISYLDNMVSDQYRFPVQPMNSESVLEVVYDEVLRQGGFVH